MNGLDSDDESGNELDTQANIGNIILMYTYKIKNL